MTESSTGPAKIVWRKPKNLTHRFGHDHDLQIMVDIAIETR
jgi:hypothetical protein